MEVREFEATNATAGPQMVPHSREAEEAVIGAVLVNPGVIDEIPLEPGEFYIHRNGWIWGVMKDLRLRKEPIDLVTVTEELDKKGLLADMGGSAYITKLINMAPSSLHAVAYGERVRETATRRETLEYANRLVKLAYDEKHDIVDARAEIADDLTNVRGTSGATHISKLLKEGFDMLETVQENPGLLAGLSTGLADLDVVMGGGLYPGMTLLVGETGLGKSILAQQIATNLTKDKHPGVFYAGEMQREDMYLRLMADWATLRVSDLRNGEIDWSAIVKAEEEMQTLPLFFDDPKNMTTSELRADLTKLKAQYGVEWMVFDFLDDLKDMEGQLQDWERSAVLATRLQDILVDLSIRGLVVHEVTKAGMENPGKAGIAGHRKVAYRAICAVQIMDYVDPDDDGTHDYVKPAWAYNMRTVKNIKQNRLAEKGYPYCDLFKDPEYPRFKLTTRKEVNLNEASKGYDGPEGWNE